MKDWLGQEYHVGDYVLYSAQHGNHGANLTLAKVHKIHEKTVSVRPLWTARHGRLTSSVTIDTRTWDKISPYSDGNWNNPDIWDGIGIHGKRVLKPYIVRKEVMPRPVTLKIVENITKYNGPIPKEAEWQHSTSA